MDEHLLTLDLYSHLDPRQRAKAPPQRDPDNYQSKYRLLPSKDTCTVHIHEFRGLATITAFGIFRAATMLTLYRHLTPVEHKQHMLTFTSIDQLSQPTQALLHALYLVQTAGE
jgi:hypothetical protein